MATSLPAAKAPTAVMKARLLLVGSSEPWVVTARILVIRELLSDLSDFIALTLRCQLALLLGCIGQRWALGNGASIGRGPPEPHSAWLRGAREAAGLVTMDPRIVLPEVPFMGRCS